MDRFEDLAMAAGAYVPDYPPMEAAPVRWSPGVSVDEPEEELGNFQVPLSGN